MTQIHNDVACSLCGCLCDDLRVTVENDRITRAERACRIAEPWLLAQNSQRPPVASIQGKSVTLAAAVDQAAKILRGSRAPLIYGLTQSGVKDQRAAVALADRLGANIDVAAPGQQAALLAMQATGVSTASLGEIRHRSDLVIFWGADPVATHPRHAERYSVEPVGEFLPGGRADRHVVIVDSQTNSTAKLADEVIPVAAGSDFDILWTLRAIIGGKSLATDAKLGAPLEALRALAERMKTCRSGVIFYGPGVTHGKLAHATLEALFQLVRELNGFTRFYASPMGEPAGAESVLAWQTGYPLAVNFARGYPRYSPGEYSADALLARGEVDACLLVGSEGIAKLSAAAQHKLNGLPTILLESPQIDGPQLDGPQAEKSTEAHVRITTSIAGVHHADSARRMDGVPIRLRALLTSEYPSQAETLKAVLRIMK